jgi:hypothetical protein
MGLGGFSHSNPAWTFADALEHSLILRATLLVPHPNCFPVYWYTLRQRDDQSEWHQAGVHYQALHK